MFSLSPQGALGMDTPVRPEASGDTTVSFGLDVCFPTCVCVDHTGPVDTNDFIRIPIL